MYDPPLELYAKFRVLQEPLSLVPDELKKQLIELEVLRYELSYNRCTWQQRLYEARQRVMLPKDSKEYTELDRKTQMDSNTALLQKDLLFMEALETIVAERLSLGKLLL